MSGRRRVERGGRVAIIVVGFAAVAACARPESPAGGPVPEVPLRVLSTTPENFSVVEPFEDRVVIEFDRLMSERVTEGTLEQAVVVSPRTADVRVRRDGRELQVALDGGFTVPTVYRITVLPRFRDRYQNSMAGPYDLVFSTGPPLEPNLLAGLVADRLSGQVVPEARVDAIGADDVVHTTVADTAGIFAFPHLPSGAYQVLAYDDRNRDMVPGYADPQDSLAVTLAPGDTLIVTDLELLAPDSTAAVLRSVVAVDSTALRAVFDDDLDPDGPLDQVVAQIVGADGTAISVGQVLFPWEWNAMRAAATAAAQAAAQNPDVVTGVDPDAPQDGVPQAPPAPGAVTGPLGPLAADAQPAGEVIDDELIFLLEAPVQPGMEYQVTISGVGNLNGHPDGGGTVTTTVPEA